MIRTLGTNTSGIKGKILNVTLILNIILAKRQEKLPILGTLFNRRTPQAKKLIIQIKYKVRVNKQTREQLIRLKPFCDRCVPNRCSYG